MRLESSTRCLLGSPVHEPILVRGAGHAFDVDGRDGGRSRASKTELGWKRGCEEDATSARRTKWKIQLLE